MMAEIAKRRMGFLAHRRWPERWAREIRNGADSQIVQFAKVSRWALVALVARSPAPSSNVENSAATWVCRRRAVPAGSNTLR